MGVSEGMGFPKSRMRKSAGPSAPVRLSALTGTVVTQGVSEGMGFPKSKIWVSAGNSTPVRPLVPERPVSPGKKTICFVLVSC